MISVMEGDKQVAGIPVKIVKSTMSKIQSKQDDVGIVILEDLSEITKKKPNSQESVDMHTMKKFVLLEKTRL